MNKVEKNPLRPYITVDQMAAYEPQREETWTESRTVNAVLEAIHHLKSPRATAIARYLDIDLDRLSAALLVETGYNLTEMLVQVKYRKAMKIEAEHPDWSSDQVAKAAGWKTRSGLWRCKQMVEHGPRGRKPKIKRYIHWPADFLPRIQD